MRVGVSGTAIHGCGQRQGYLSPPILFRDAHGLLNDGAFNRLFALAALGRAAIIYVYVR